MIAIQGLQKRFGTNTVLDNLTFRISEGDVFGIVGHSGAGKSTLLRCINGLETYDKGSLRVMGHEVGTLSAPEIKNLRKQIGMIFQNFNLLNRRDVAGNIALPMELWGEPQSRIKERVDELLELVGLSDKRNERVQNLSGGQKQRVGIARALALNPKILLCDEATSALDPKTTISILELLMDINRRFNLTLVVVTHQMEVVKMACNKVAILDGGVLKAYGETEDLFLAPPEGLRRLVRDEYAYIPTGINIRLMFPSEIANESVISGMARNLDCDFSIVGGRIERYRETVMGFLIINVADKDYPKVLEYLKENRLYWEVMKDGE